jgi:hypothetical protein
VQVREWLHAYARAWRERDDDAVANLFTEDAVYRSHPFRPPHAGRDAIKTYWRRVTSTQKSVDVQFGEPVISGSRVAVEWWAVVDEEGDGKVTFPGCLVLRFAEDGRCQELREYWHSEPGRHQPPDGWGE